MCLICRAGSNGHEYQFLLKGHEDLRQDERVMQLFGLVNSLLLSNPETLRRNLTYVIVITSYCQWSSGVTFCNISLSAFSFTINQTSALEAGAQRQ